MSSNGIWRPKETLNGFKFINANGYLRGTFQWKCIVFKAGVVAQSFSKKEGHEYCYLWMHNSWGGECWFFKCDDEIPH